MDSRLVTAIVVFAVIVVLWVIGKIISSRLPEQIGGLVGQLVPVVILAVAVVGILLIIDPDQADRLLEAVISAVPKVMVALIVIIIARALGRIVGVFIETALRRVSAVMATRAKLAAAAIIMAVGVIIAMQQIGIPANIILILVAALSFGVALAVALSVGVGSVPMARQIAAGRHVQNRYRPGDRVRLRDVEGTVAEIGLSTTRIATGAGRYVDIPNNEFIETAVSVEA